jgi:hypothetical protein
MQQSTVPYRDHGTKLINLRGFVGESWPASFRGFSFNGKWHVAVAM